MPALFIVPLTVIPLILYNIVGFIWGLPAWTGEIFGITMVSGARWSFSTGDLMVIFGIGCLFFEVLKSTNSTSREITNHILSTVILVIYILEFILVGIAASSTFFILLVISLFDVVAGFSITIKAASRDVSYNRTIETRP
jgi:hypothetical protein